MLYSAVVVEVAPNGPAVWLVGVSVAVAWFLQVQVNLREPTGHDEIVKTAPSPGDGCEFWVTIK